MSDLYQYGYVIGDDDVDYFLDFAISGKPRAESTPEEIEMATEMAQQWAELQKPPNPHHVSILSNLASTKKHAAIIGESVTKERRVTAAIALEAAANQLAALARAVQEAE